MPSPPPPALLSSSVGGQFTGAGGPSHPVDAKAAKAPVEDVLGHLKAQLAVVGHDLELGKSEKVWCAWQGVGGSHAATCSEGFQRGYCPRLSWMHKSIYQ